MKEEKAPPRLVLFFDTHEAFWRYQRDLSQERFFYYHEWLRRLLLSLDRSQGIVTVIAGRDKPGWGEAKKFPVSEKKTEMYVIPHFSTADAGDYLKKARISDPALQESLMNYARVGSYRIHPFFLGLCADAVLSAERRGISLAPGNFARTPEAEMKGEILMARVLKYVDEEIQDSIHVLSACRGFDRDLYFRLGDGLRFYATHTSFRTLTRFSFVERERQDSGHYRIYDLLRRLYHKHANERTSEAHEFLERYYREQENVADAVYHAICLNFSRGAEEWFKAHCRAKQEGDSELCNMLKEIRNETSLYLDKSLRQWEMIFPR